VSRPGRIRGQRDLHRLSISENEARIRAAEALHEMRKGMAMAAAARKHHTSPATIRRYFGHLLHRTSKGRYAAAPSDREPFLMDVLGPRGPVTVVVRGSGARQLNLEHHRALARFAGPDGGDLSTLKRFRGKRVAGVDLLVDPDQIERGFEAGEFEFLEYQSF
jgi:hypothetical protein